MIARGKTRFAALLPETSSARRCSGALIEAVTGANLPAPDIRTYSGNNGSLMHDQTRDRPSRPSEIPTPSAISTAVSELRSI